MSHRSLSALLAWFAVLLSAFGQEPVMGESREDILARYGKPSSIAKRGSQEIFQYPKGGRIVFIDGKVSEARAPLPPPLAVVPVAPAAAPAPEPPSPTPAASPSADAGSPAPTPAQVKSQTPVAPSEASALDKLGQALEEMDRAKEDSAKAAAHAGELHIGELLVSLVLHFGITLLALRLAFKYWEMDALWPGVFAIAGIDLGLYAVLELLGPFTSGLSQMATLQSGIGTLVMIPVIQHFCFNKRLQNAVLTALAVKVIVQLCHVFLFVLLLNALFA